MKNIRLYEPSDFTNILPEIRLSSSDIENQTADIGYVNDTFRTDAAETEFPIEMVPVFYRFVTREQRIPTQNEFLIEAGREMRMNGFDLDAQNDEYRRGLTARLTSRTYPSLIRDLHFCKLLTSGCSGRFDVFYNPALDMAGIDILMIPRHPDAPYFGVCLYLDTQKGKNGLLRKRKYRKTYYNVKYIELPKKIPSNTRQDGIWLYDTTDVNNLLTLISSDH